MLKQLVHSLPPYLSAMEPAAQAGTAAESKASQEQVAARAEACEGSPPASSAAPRGPEEVEPEAAARESPAPQAAPDTEGDSSNTQASHPAAEGLPSAGPASSEDVANAVASAVQGEPDHPSAPGAADEAVPAPSQQLSEGAQLPPLPTQETAPPTLTASPTVAASTEATPDSSSGPPANDTAPPAAAEAESKSCSSTAVPPAATEDDSETKVSKDHLARSRSRSRSRGRGEGLGQKLRQFDPLGLRAEASPQAPEESPSPPSSSSTALPKPAAATAKTWTGVVDAGAITAQLRAVAGDRAETLAVLVGLTCVRLAAHPGFCRKSMREELLPHLQSAPGESLLALEDFLDWLEAERTATPPRAECPFEVGDEVMLVGLQNRPELNEKRAVVTKTSVLDQPGRCIITIQGRSAPLAVRWENMRAVSRSSENARSKSETSEPTQRRAPTESPAGSPALRPKPEPHSAPGEESAAATKGQPPLSEPAVPRSQLFSANLERLKARAKAEASGEVPRGPANTRRGGVGSAHPAGSQWRVQKQEPPPPEPIHFVAAEDQPAVPSRKVIVVDPRGRGRRSDGKDSSDDDIPEPGHIPLPPKRHPPSPELGPMVEVPVTLTTSAAAAMVHSALLPPAATAPAAAPTASSPATAGKRRHMTLVVSEQAKEEDEMHRETAHKKRAIEDQRRKMLEKLTTQLQVCLARVQAGDLDDLGKEKYQDMISSLKEQMAKISHV